MNEKELTNLEKMQKLVGVRVGLTTNGVHGVGTLLVSTKPDYLGRPVFHVSVGNERDWLVVEIAHGAYEEHCEDIDVERGTIEFYW